MATGTDQPVAASSFFGQVESSSPSSTGFVPGENGGIPVDLGQVFGPDGLNLSAGAPDILGGATQLVSGIRRAVTGQPLAAAPPQQAPVSGNMLLILLVGGVVVWLALRS